MSPLSYFQTQDFTFQTWDFTLRDTGNDEGSLGCAGVGAYTSRSVASIGCQEAVAAVDANVVRVLSRLRRCSLPGIGPGAATYQELASQVLDPERPGDFNQVCLILHACL